MGPDTEYTYEALTAVIVLIHRANSAFKSNTIISSKYCALIFTCSIKILAVYSSIISHILMSMHGCCGPPPFFEGAVRVKVC